MKKRVAFPLLWALVGAIPALAQMAPHVFKPGEKVEVREGDVWSAATIITREGRRYQIRYNSVDAATEWVTPDRLRIPISTPQPAPVPGMPRQPLASQRGAAPGVPSPGDVPLQSDPAYRATTLDAVPELSLTPVPWSVPPSALPAPLLDLRPLPLHPPADLSQHLVEQSSIALSRSAPIATVSYNIEPPGSTSATSLELLNLQGGPVRARKSLGNNLQLLGLSPNGRLAAFRSTHETAGSHNRLEIWSLADDQAARQLLLVPYPPRPLSQSDVEIATFVDDTHLLTASTGEAIVVLWDLQVARPVWKFTNRTLPALSSDGRLLALQTDDAIAIVEALSGKVTGILPLDALRQPTCAFSPSGKVLAAMRDGDFRAWNLADGSLISSFSIPLTGNSILMTGDGYLLVDNHFLIDLTRRLIVWDYTGPEALLSQARGGLFAITVDPHTQAAALRSLHLPDAATAREIEAAAAAAKDLYLLQPGTHVRWTNQMGGDPAVAKTADAAAAANLQAAGFVVDAKAAVQIRGTTSTGLTELRKFEHLLPTGNREITTVSIIPQISTITIESNGRTLWQRSTTFVPGSGGIAVKKGQLAQQAVDEQSKPDTAFFGTVRIPRYMAKPFAKPGFGSSPLVD